MNKTFKNKQKVTIILPCYNQVQYVRNSIDSVLSQSYRNIELVLIDNVSTDGTKETLQEYEKKDSRVKCIYHRKNMGFTVSINDGFAAASGDFIAIQNSDDVWHPDKLEKQLQVFNENPEIDVVVSDANVINENGRFLGYLLSQEIKWDKFGALPDAFEDLCDNNFCCHPSLIFRKSCLLSVSKYDESLKYACDWWFLIILAKNHKFYYIKDPLLEYRIHPYNTSKKKDLVYTDMMIIRKRIADIGVKKGSNLSKAALFAALLSNKNAKKFAAEALLKGNLNFLERVAMKFILNFNSAGKIFLKLNQLRHFSFAIIYKIKNI